MGVPRRVYRAFATFLAGHGFPTLTFDYCGVAGSRAGLRTRPGTTIEDWALLDLPAAVEAAAAQRPGLPLVHLAHSVGGQILGLAPAETTDRYRAAVLVASQIGDWRLWPPRQKPLIWALWHLVIPLTTLLLGRFPSRWFGMGETLPRGAALQWARWGRRRDYLFGISSPRAPRRHGELRILILAVSFEADLYAAPRGVEGLLDRYAGCAITRRVIGHGDPEPRPGHFTFFRRELGEPYWSEVVAFLDASLPSHAAL
jgi:predicted alpha/beta hydrolase